jgi:hypothetical protein
MAQPVAPQVVADAMASSGVLPAVPAAVITNGRQSLWSEMPGPLKAFVALLLAVLVMFLLYQLVGCPSNQNSTNPICIVGRIPQELYKGLSAFLSNIWSILAGILAALLGFFGIKAWWNTNDTPNDGGNGGDDNGGNDDNNNNNDNDNGGNDDNGGNGGGNDDGPGEGGGGFEARRAAARRRALGASAARPRY